MNECALSPDVVVDDTSIAIVALKRKGVYKIDCSKAIPGPSDDGVVCD